jgi:hypothetical protein
MQRILICRPESVKTFQTLPNRYRFQPWGKWRWLQNLSRRLFEKLSTPCMEEQTKVAYSEVVIDTNALLQAVGAHMQDVWNLRCGRRPRYLIMGEEDFLDIMNQSRGTAVGGGLMFAATLNAPGTPQALFGMEIIVVPWIKGWFALPGLEEMR